MNRQTQTGRGNPALTLAAAGIVLAGSLYINLARAQGPQDQPGVRGQGGPNGFPPQGPGGFGQRGDRGGPGFGGPGGPGGMPFVMGQITGGNVDSGVITVNSQFGGQQTIRVGANTQMVTQKTVSASALQVDDQVQVQGVPTAITANSITAGQLPQALQPGGMSVMGGPGFGGRGGQIGNRGNQPAFASATGKVTSTSPLTISVNDSVSIVVKLASDAKVTKIQKIALNGLKVGDTVMATGQATADGTFNASVVGVNLSGGFGGPGMFGPGGPGGFGGPGGRGGFGPRGPGGGPGGDGPDNAP